ncbi:hypothetical protein [Jongsikchunia kroppenstedtii]|uniref:hypothetical protein n=1 Tax=Jongsikchunia kroppenstedtii TaxID=1121721 RepID=UPI0003A4C3E2|nr:hypothetical protein [Jongsikchunia kroppenstedtii]
MRPTWRWTGYRYFPYAARHDRQWWVLRLNWGFPEHDLFTLFIDGRAIGDITPPTRPEKPFELSVAPLRPFSGPAGPVMDAQTAKDAVGALTRYADYGSERDDPCMFCSSDGDDGADLWVDKT